MHFFYRARTRRNYVTFVLLCIDTTRRLRLLCIEFHGQVVHDANSGKKMVIIRDPDGNRIQFFEKKTAFHFLFLVFSPLINTSVLSQN